MTFSPRYWKKLINRAVAHAGLQLRRLWEVTKTHRQIHQALQEKEFTIPEPPTNLIDMEEFHACMSCRRRFRSHAGQGAHMFRVHKQVAPTRRFLDAAQCPSCLREYHSFGKLKAHLHYSSSCRQALSRNRPCPAIAPGAGSTVDTALVRDHGGLQPVQQALGPQLPGGPLAELDTVHYTLHAELCAALLDSGSLSEVKDGFQQRILNTAISWTDCRTTIQFLVDSLTPADIATMEFSEQEVRALCADLCHPDAWWDFFPDIVVEKKFDFYELEEVFATVASRPCGLRPRSPTVARPVGAERYVLHAFSGRRRRGDVQHFLDSFASQLENTLLLVLSVDVIIHPQMGDLASEEVQNFWLHAISQRWVLAVLAGPPCNSWSRARSIETQDQRGPRPLRDAENPWGKRSLGLKEMETVLFGNCLMLWF